MWEPSKNLLPRAAIILVEYIAEKDLPSPKLMPVQSVPIYEKDAWLNQYAKRFIPKEESQEYPKKFLFLPRNGDIIPVELKPTDQMFCARRYANLKKTFNNNLLQKMTIENDEDEE